MFSSEVRKSQSGSIPRSEISLESENESKLNSLINKCADAQMVFSAFKFGESHPTLPLKEVLEKINKKMRKLSSSNVMTFETQSFDPLEVEYYDGCIAILKKASNNSFRRSSKFNSFAQEEITKYFTKRLESIEHEARKALNPLEFERYIADKNSKLYWENCVSTVCCVAFLCFVVLGFGAIQKITGISLPDD